MSFEIQNFRIQYISIQSLILQAYFLNFAVIITFSKGMKMKNNDIREHYSYQICNLLTRKGNLYIFVNSIYFYLNNLTLHNRL